MQTVFIGLYRTLEEAMSYRNGAQMTASTMIFNGVQLLPNQTAPYIQRTYTPNGIEISSFEVKVMSMCGEQLADITDKFLVTNTFQDENTGLNQLYWSLTDLPDIGEQLIYLHVDTSADGEFFSTPFMITAEGNSEWFHYRNKETDIMQSTGLQMYYRQDNELTEISTYTTITGEKQIVQEFTMIEFEIYQTKIIDYQVLRRFKALNRFRYRYMGFKPFNLIEVPETKEFENNENFVQAVIKVQRDFAPDKVYNPFYVQPAPPPPPPQLIILNSVTSISSIEVSYDFELIDITPTYLNYQSSLDQVNWTNATSGSISPETIGRPDNLTNNFYYRIYSPQFDTYSNKVQIALPSITLEKVYSPDPQFRQTGNKYVYEFTLNNFTPNTQLKFETSVDGIIWDFGNFPSYGQGNDSPKQVNTGSGQERKFFRIRYVSSDFSLQLTSNVEQFEF